MSINAQDATIAIQQYDVFLLGGKDLNCVHFIARIYADGQTLDIVNCLTGQVSEVTIDSLEGKWQFIGRNIQANVNIIAETVSQEASTILINLIGTLLITRIPLMFIPTEIFDALKASIPSGADTPQLTQLSQVKH